MSAAQRRGKLALKKAVASLWRHCVRFTGPGIEPGPPALIEMSFTTTATG